MIIQSIFAIAARALWANKLRSGLTLLGVIIGVTSVMTIVSALEGMQAAVAADLNQLGPTTFIVTRIGIITSEEMFFDKIKRKPIEFDAAELIDESCENCERIAVRSQSMARVKYGNESMREVFIAGSTSSLVDIVDLEVALGRFHSEEDDQFRRPVAFIGDGIREKFFPTVDPLGKEIRIGGQRLTVIGVSKKSNSVFGGDSENNFVIIPLSTFKKHFPIGRNGYSLFVKAASLESMQDAIDETRIILRAQRKVPFDAGDDFDILTADNILDLLNQLTSMIRLGLIGISSISLVVGGIVVMNIMMVSVTERTREIGIRKSIGAKRRHLLLQFLFEALILTVGGGMLGIVFGFLIAKTLVSFIDMDIDPSALAIILGFGISGGTGVIFGMYPAVKAARLDPIKALSYE